MIYAVTVLLISGFLSKEHWIQIILLALSTLLMVALGIEIGATWAYWAAVPVTVWLQSLQYRAIKNRNRQVCFQTFLANNRIGQVWFLAIFAHTFLMAPQ